MALSPVIRRRREHIVREHMESENRHEFDTTLDTFDHPRYELMATGEVFDGPEEVMGYFEYSRRAFPDQRNELVAMHHSDDAVLVEAIIRGTHLGPLGGLPPTGRSYELPILSAFMFEGDRLVCERVYFDTATLFVQLGVASGADSVRGRLGTVVNHPVTIGRGVVRRLTGR